MKVLACRFRIMIIKVENRPISASKSRCPRTFAEPCILLIMYARLGGHSQFVNHPPLIIILSFNPWGIKLFTLPCITQFHPCISKLFNRYYPLSAEPLGRTPRMGGIRESTVENGVERLTLTQSVLLLNYAHSFSMLLFSSQNPS